MTDFISREELLEGSPGRRAHMLLFAVESRTAQLVARSRQATALMLTPESAQAREQRFLEALAGARAGAPRAHVQDLERHARGWRDLVPPNPATRAALVRLLGERFLLYAPALPALRGAVGADNPTVQEAYRRLYGGELGSVYVERLPVRERLRWLRARISAWLEDLPPVWTAFALTLTGTVGTTSLALPIATAAVGPAAGMATLIGLAAVTILTIVGMSESVTRNGAMHYGSSYLGRLVAELLDSTTAAIFTFAALFAIVFALLVRFLGFALTLGAGTAVPAAAWAGLLFAVNLYYLRRGTFESTVSTTLVVGAVNVALLVALSLVALPHARSANLGYVHLPRAADGSLDTSALGLVFGVALGIYARHISVGSAAKVVLPRDPGGRSLLRGCSAGLAAAAALSCLWVLAVNAALAPRELIGDRGTALAPLADVTGPATNVLGGAFAVLAMGLGSIAMSLALFYHVHEWLPREATRRTRLAAGAAPVVGLFALVEWLLLTDRASFTGAIAFVNAVTGPVLSGIFPVLLLAASRRKGDYVPGTIWAFLNRPIVAAALYAFFAATLIAYALVLWEDPVPRVVAGVSGVVMLGMTARILTRGELRPQIVVELRTDEHAERGVVNVTVDGSAVGAERRVEVQAPDAPPPTGLGKVVDLDDGTTLCLRLPQSEARSLKIWLHRVTADGESRPLAAEIAVAVGSRELRFTGDQAVLALGTGSDATSIRISGLER